MVLESDNLQVTNAIQRPDEDGLLPFGSSIMDCLTLSKSFLSFSCCFVKRSGNKLARALALLSLSNSVVIADTVIPADLASII